MGDGLQTAAAGGLLGVLDTVGLGGMVDVGDGVVDGGDGVVDCGDGVVECEDRVEDAVIDDGDGVIDVGDGVVDDGSNLEPVEVGEEAAVDEPLTDTEVTTEDEALEKELDLTGERGEVAKVVKAAVVASDEAVLDASVPVAGSLLLGRLMT